jgi:hypothetical protein
LTLKGAFQPGCSGHGVILSVWFSHPLSSRWATPMRLANSVAVAHAPAHPTHRCIPFRSETNSNFWSLVGFTTTYYTISFLKSRPHSLPSLIVLFVSLFPSSIPCYTIDSRTSLRNGRVILLVHRPSHHGVMALRRHSPTITNATAIAPLLARLFYSVSPFLI